MGIGTLPTALLRRFPVIYSHAPCARFSCSFFFSGKILLCSTVLPYVATRSGDVTYDITDFMEKAKDALAVKILDQLKQSALSLIRDDIDLGKSEAPAGGGKGKGGKQTLAAKFKADLDSLMTNLRSTSPHFIRCTKPNDFQQRDRFDPPLTLNQLKYSGKYKQNNFFKH